MSFIHPYSDEATSSELELFKIPSTVTAIESARYFHYKPAASLTSSNWIEFRVAGTEEFVDLSSLLLEVELSVTLLDGQPLPGKAAATGSPTNLFDEITPVNNLLSSLFQQFDLFLNNTLVTTATNLYHYRAYLDNLFYQSEKAKKTYMFPAFWEEDEGKRKQRFKRVYSGKTLKLLGPIHYDLGQQERLLLNFVDMNLRFNLADPSFCFTIGGNTTDRPKFSIINATLHVLKKRLFSDCEAGILQALGKQSCKYFFTQTQLRHRVIDSGSSSFFCDNLFPSTLPRRFIIGLLPAKSFNGDYKSDAFSFSHNDLIDVKAFVDSIQTPVPSLELDIDNDEYARAYHLFYEAMNSIHPQATLSITPDQFKSNSTFFAWTLSTENDLDDSDTIGLIRRGHVRLDFRFSKPTTEQIVVVIYSHFPQIIQIDSTREVMIESV